MHVFFIHIVLVSNQTSDLQNRKAAISLRYAPWILRDYFTQSFYYKALGEVSLRENWNIIILLSQCVNLFNHWCCRSVKHVVKRNTQTVLFSPDCSCIYSLIPKHVWEPGSVCTTVWLQSTVRLITCSLSEEWRSPGQLMRSQDHWRITESCQNNIVMQYQICAHWKT